MNGASASSKTALGPINPSERIESLDILRGFAIFGVLWVNLTAMSWTDHDGLLDAETFLLMRTFGAGKFITLFMFLFGAGFAIQLRRAQRRGLAVRFLYLRRMGVLAVFGVAHHLFGAIGGEILLPYAFAGAHLLLLERVPRRILLVLAVPIWLSATFALGTEMQQGLSTPREGTPWVLDAYQQEEFLDSVAIRGKRIANWTLYGFYDPEFAQTVAVFVLGWWAVLYGLFDDPSSHRLLFRRVVGIGLSVGLLLSLIGAIRFDWVLRYLGATPLGLAYGAGLMLLLEREAWRRRLASLAPIGRMALTNYLLHSVIFSTLHASYGFGVHWLSPVESLLATLLLYPAQAAFSAWWLRRNRFGPFEWLWRTLAYGRVQTTT